MQAWIPLITQALPLVIPMVAPLVVKGLEALIEDVGKAIPPTLKPVLNAALGALLSAISGSDPSTGALIAHITRSGMSHEAPTEPPAPATP